MTEELNGLRALLTGWSDGWDYWTKGVQEKLPFGLGTIEVIEYQHGSSDYDDGVPYVIIFKLVSFTGDVRYFRKSGYVSSYTYDISWSGEFREVKPIEKVTYEYV